MPAPSPSTSTSTSLHGKRVLITGGTSGFGEAMAHAFAGAGANLILVARGQERLTATADEIRTANPTVQIETLAGDVCEPATFERAKECVLGAFEGLDILINNAGAGVAIRPIDEQTAEEIEESLHLNLHSAIHACRIFAPLFKQQGSGLIINVSSACAKFAWPGWSVYSAAKAGLGMFSRCLYTELRPHGIAVTHLVPGAAKTGFHAAAGMETRDSDPPKSLRPAHIAHAALSIATQPPGGVIPEIVVYGQSQEIVPF